MEVIKRYSKLLLLIGIVLFCFSSCKEDVNKKEDSQPIEELVITPKISALTYKISENELDANLRFQRAEALYDEGLYEQATEDLRIAIKVDSLQPKYYHLLSDVFMDSNNSSKALQTMKVAAGLFPERIMTLLKLSETHYILTQFEESIARLNTILGIDPNNAEAYFMLGLNFKSMGDEDRALNAFQTATEFDAQIIDAWIAIGSILEKRGNDRAENYYKTAASIDPNNIYALHNLAYYYQERNKEDEAIEIYDNIINIDRNYGAAYLNQGILLLEKQEYDRANERFVIYTSQNTLDPKGYFYQGYIAYALGDTASAIVFLENAINLDPEYEKAILLLEELNNKSNNG